jgi:hypothetical protein
LHLYGHASCRHILLVQAQSQQQGWHFCWLFWEAPGCCCGAGGFHLALLHLLLLLLLQLL